MAIVAAGMGALCERACCLGGLLLGTGGDDVLARLHFVMLLYLYPRAALLCGENGAKSGVVFSAQLEWWKGVMTFL